MSSSERDAIIYNNPKHKLKVHHIEIEFHVNWLMSSQVDILTENSPPLAPITATLLWATELVDSWRPRAETGFWNLENILIEVVED